MVSSNNNYNFDVKLNDLDSHDSFAAKALPSSSSSSSTMTPLTSTGSTRTSNINRSTMKSYDSRLFIRLYLVLLLLILSYAGVSTVFFTNHGVMNNTKHRNLSSIHDYYHDYGYLDYFIQHFVNFEYKHSNNNIINNNHRSLFKESDFPQINQNNDNENDNNDNNDNENDNGINPSNKICRNYLKQFLSGTTDVRDECEGLENAYDASDCQSTEGDENNDNGNPKSIFLYQDSNNNNNTDNGNNSDSNTDDNTPAIDDFFEEFECCKVISHYYSSKCLYHQRYASLSLLGIVSVLILCSLTKTILHSCTLISLQWLPEAGGCIIVGAVVSLILKTINKSSSTMTLFDYSSSFDDELFMYILLPPIIFQASLSIHKKQFTKLLYPILMFAVFGTFLSSVLIGYIVHYGTYYIPNKITTTIPLLDSMLYGSLISSIDPVATLSILGSMGIATDHVLYVVVFGESILNDGVAIALFDSLKMHLEKNGDNHGSNINYNIGGAIDHVLVKESVQYFFKICIGSVSVGVFVGILCTIYFWLLRGKQTPVMEVATFFCFAFIAYYSSDGLLGCSGIVSIMTAGFIMDIYVRGYGLSEQDEEHEIGPNSNDDNSADNGTHYSGQENGDHLYASLSSPGMTTSARCCWDNHFSIRTFFTDCKIMFSGVGHMSYRAKVHVGFVADVLANLMETAIFGYLGLFLFSNKKWDDIPLIIIGIISCVLSRVLMIWITSAFVNGGLMLNKYCSHCVRRVYHRVNSDADEPMSNQQSNITFNGERDNFFIDRNMQLVLLYSGVRGAVSLALAENIPLYDAVTKNGSSFKPALKAMTSSSIIFTVFFFGASTYFTLKQQQGRINQEALDDENQIASSNGFIRGIWNRNILGFNHDHYDLSLQDSTRNSLNTSLLQSDTAGVNDGRHLPPWMGASGR